MGLAYRMMASRRMSRRERHRLINARNRRNGSSWGGHSRTHRQCIGKRKFQDEDSAREAVADVQSRIVMINGVGPKGRLDTYHCLRCGSRHLGNREYRKE